MIAGMTIPQLLAATVARAGDQRALGTIANGKLSWRTWAEIDSDVQSVAARLQHENIRVGDRVAQWAPNSYAWIVTDLALLQLGAVHVPLHMSLAPRQVGELLELADAKLLIVDGGRGDAESLAAESLASAARLPLLRHEVLFASKPFPGPSLNTSGQEGRGILLGDQLATQLATLLFTSGTTGQPRGVMLSHENLTSNAIALCEAVGSKSNETRLCFLPLSHIYARTCDLYNLALPGIAIGVGREPRHDRTRLPVGAAHGHQRSSLFLSETRAAVT